MEQITTPAQLPVAQRARNALAVTPEYEKRLQEIATKHSDIVAITNEDGLKQCHAARMEKKNERLDIEKRAKAARQDAQDFAKAMIGEEKRLIAIINPEEERLGKLEDGWHADREAERQAKAKAEAERVAAIQKRIDAMDKLPAQMVSKSASELSVLIDQLAADNPETWAQEFLPLATMTHRDVLYTLRSMHAQRVAADDEAKRQAEERAKIEAENRLLAEKSARFEAEQRAAREKADAEERERRRRIEEEERQARLKREEEERAARKRIDDAEREAKAKREVEELRLKAEREELERIREAAEARARAELQAEEDRIKAEQDKLDAARRAEEERQHQARLTAEREAEAKARAERERLEAEQRVRDEAARMEREQREVAEREKRRQEAEHADALHLLQTFLERHGKKPEFAVIVAAIRSHFDKRKAA